MLEEEKNLLFAENLNYIVNLEFVTCDQIL